MFQSSHHEVRQAALFALALTLAVTALAAGKGSTEAGGRKVSLYLDVEKGDKLIRGLKAGNFRLYEDGESRSFQLEKPETPATVALVVEFSQSSWMYMDDIQRAMQAFLQEAPEGNWYALVTFSHQTNILVDFTKQKGEITQAFNDLQTPNWDEIDTYDALYDTLDRLERLPGRRVLIFIGSGFDTFSEHTLEEVQKKVEASDVNIFCLGAGSLLRGQYEPYLSDTGRMNLLQAQSFMKMLASKSGGQAWFPKFASAFPDIMQGVMQDLAFQYRLVYTSHLPADGKFHKIEVKAFTIENDQRTDYKVRVREGWRFEK